MLENHKLTHVNTPEKSLKTIVWDALVWTWLRILESWHKIDTLSYRQQGTIPRFSMHIFGFRYALIYNGGFLFVYLAFLASPGAWFGCHKTTTWSPRCPVIIPCSVIRCSYIFFLLYRLLTYSNNVTIVRMWCRHFVLKGIQQLIRVIHKFYSQIFYYEHVFDQFDGNVVVMQWPIVLCCSFE